MDQYVYVIRNAECGQLRVVENNAMAKEVVKEIKDTYGTEVGYRTDVAKVRIEKTF